MAALPVSMLCVAVMLSVVCADVKLDFQEPHCSKYAFEEKILEKSVRTEHVVQLMDEKLKLFDKTFEKLLEDVKQQQNKLEMTQNAVVQKVEDAVREAENTVTRAAGNAQRQMENISEVIAGDRVKINDTLYKLIENTTAAVKHMKEELSASAVVFYARDLANYSPSRGSLMRFTNPTVNIAEAYSASTGYFTAPSNGVYKFTLQICPTGNRYIDTRIVAAGAEIAGLRHYSSDGYSAVCTSGEAMAALKSGDQVWIKCDSRSSSTPTIHNGGTSYTSSFSGVLLHHNSP